MGLFDRFKKQKKAEVQEAQQIVETQESAEEIKEVAAEAVEEKVEVANPAERQDVTENKAVVVEEGSEEFRRFTLLVEDLTVLPETQGVVVGGILYGTVQKGDAIYLIQPRGNIVPTKVEGIEVGPGQTADKAQNQKITILLRDIKTATEVPKYTVLTSIKPQTAVDTKVPVENPQLLGLSMDYPRLCRDNTYVNLMIYVLCHANYVVPVSVEAGGAVDGKETQQVRFPALQNPADKSKNVFPIFTDWEALKNWKNLFDETHPPKSVIMRFPDVVAVCKGSGVVVNAFGPTPVILSEEMMAQIVGTEGYQQEFGGAPTDTVQKQQLEQEAKVIVGVPKENEEIKLIKEALVTQAKREKEIQRVDFLLKVDMQQERAYLCIVDCPEEQATKLFTALHKAAAPYFNEVKRLEFLLYGKSKLANDVVSEKSIIYQIQE